jgi:hypothetical protein
MKSRVRFEVLGRVAVDQGCDYSVSAVTAEVATGELIALSVEVEHADDWALDDIVQAARAALRPLCALIGIGRGIKPVLGGALVSPVTTEGPSIGLGFADAQARVAIVRRLKTLPPESLLAALRVDSQLARQADYLNSAVEAGDSVSQFRYAYLVLEQEKQKSGGYTPPDGFTHIRDALSHPELGNSKAKAFLRTKIRSAQLDLHNPTHARFLEKQCALLLKEARRLVEGCVASLGCQFWC